MFRNPRSALLAIPLALAGLSPVPVQAQTYPVDCAILLCLAGGWPTSLPCVRARAEFIRRITPWPIEPPLQIWLCPMGAAAEIPAPDGPLERLYEISLRASADGQDNLGRPALPLVRVQSTGQADIDISGSAFDFVRSIHVYHVQVRQGRDHDGDCSHYDATRLGSYGLQGGFGWSRSSAAAVPVGSALTVPSNCADYNYRSVLVEWRDQAGHYGFEEVRY